ncbi:F0F1 ATP synthase subunit B [Kitasatospora sp. NPDC049258]|uniref:F0F1 ATP synthase subunit B family protein n=1 Tax=Kitasatospora sp. NPDC049258 TaxID=3155394 RepID=UPI003445FD04
MGPLKPDPAELLIGLLVFFVTFALLGKVLLPRVERILAERRDATEGRQERAEQLRAEAEDTLAALRHEISTAQHEAARIRQEATEQGLALMAEIRAEGQRERAELVAAARAAIALDRELAEIELHAQVGDLAIELAGRVVGESLADLAEQRRTVERFLDSRGA